MNAKVPIILVTGFLGSGKTSFLGQILKEYSTSRKIAVVQNEFAQSSIDGLILRELKGEFTLKELNTGSIFCSCLFSQFKNLLIELSQSVMPDLVLVEATGIADPIAIAELMEDERVSQNYYLSRIFTVVDAPRFSAVLSKIMGVRNQVQVADVVLINKVDLVDHTTMQQVIKEVAAINPLTKIVIGNRDNFDVKPLFNDDLMQSGVLEKGLKGKLTRCGDGDYISKSFKTTAYIELAKLEAFLASLGEDILRLKGYITTPQGESFVVQYVPGHSEIIPCTRALGYTELISIGYVAPPYAMLQ